MKHKVLRTILPVVMLLFGLIASPVVGATFTQITQPDAAYLASTTKIDISGLPFGSNHTAITDGSLTVSFSTPMNKLGPVPNGWATWSSPPFSESPNPHVLWTQYGTTSLNMTLSQPVTTFGFELEPNPFTTITYNVQFILMSGGTIVGTITIPVNGHYGARLFAASVTGGSFDQIVINGGADFAIAQVRYATNVSPTSDANGPYTGSEGSPVDFDGTGSSDPDGDTLTFDWDFGDSSTGTGPTPSHTYADNSLYTVCLTVTDPGGLSDTQCTTADIANVAPTATLNAPAVVDEGSDINLSLTGPYDPSSVDTTAGFEYAFDCGDGAGYSSFSGSNSAVCPTSDNGTPTAKGKIRDKDGGETEYTASVTINNVDPTVGPITVDQTLVAVGTPINASAGFTDLGTADTHTAMWDWGDGTAPGTVSETGGSGSVADSHTYSAAGIYTVQLTVTDDDGGSGQSVFQYVVVYDPSAGFVTGGGWIDSPEGAYKPDESLTGKANFGFVSKYKKGADTPTGNTEFQFHVASLNFHSDTYEWLVVTGSDYARFKGMGTINGEGAYKFMLWAGDGEPDTFRIRIWEEDEVSAFETDIYDNGFDQAIGGGSIVIHTSKK